ncbi:hypothetical protein T06_1726 [Trichinella sp. T6]|nr:hypothetical protein T06_1726 [Trichinella sp. T6]
MGGVDLTVMLISSYRIDHKCRTWHRRQDSENIQKMVLGAQA